MFSECGGPSNPTPSQTRPWRTVVKVLLKGQRMLRLITWCQLNAVFVFLLFLFFNYCWFNAELVLHSRGGQTTAVLSKCLLSGFVILRFLLLLLLLTNPPIPSGKHACEFPPALIGLQWRGSRERERETEREKECVCCGLMVQCLSEKKVWKRRKTADLWKKCPPPFEKQVDKPRTTLVFPSISSGYHGEFVLNVFFFFFSFFSLNWTCTSDEWK